MFFFLAICLNSIFSSRFFIFKNSSIYVCTIAYSIQVCDKLFILHPSWPFPRRSVRWTQHLNLEYCSYTNPSSLVYFSPFKTFKLRNNISYFHNNNKNKNNKEYYIYIISQSAPISMMKELFSVVSHAPWTEWTKLRMVIFFWIIIRIIL